MPNTRRSSTVADEGMPHPDRLRVLSLFVRHGVDKYTGAHDTLKEYYSTRLPDTDVTTVILDNALPEGRHVDTIDGTQLFGSSNAAWEFSAWDSALKALRPSLMRYDYIHFVTSAYQQLYTAFIDRIDTALLLALQGRDVALGHIDAYNTPVRILGRTTQAWLRSSFAFVPPATLRRLGPMASLHEATTWFSRDPASPFHADAPLSPDFRSHIIQWLTGEGTGQGSVWHSRFELNSDTLGHFEAKALAILNEHLLSLRLQTQGTAMVDATWMAATLRQAPGVRRDSLIDWRRQIAERQPYV